MRVILWLAAVLCIAAAIACLFASNISFTSARAIVVSAVPPGYEDRFTPGLYRKMVLGLRLLGAGLPVVALGLVFVSKPLARLLDSAFRSVTVTVVEIGDEIPRTRDGLVHLSACAAVFIWAVWLRLFFFQEPVRKDEAYSYLYYASRPLFVGLTYYTANNHLLNTFLMHCSTSLFGLSLWSVRLPTVIAGILLLPATYIAVRLYHGKNAALLASALIAASSPLIEYSFNARGYGFGALFMILMVLMIGMATVRASNGGWILLPVMAALALYSVPTMVYGVAGAFLYLLLSRSAWRRTLIAMTATGALSVLFYAPVFATVGLSAMTNNKWTAAVPRNLWWPLFQKEIGSLWKYWNMDVPPFIVFLIVWGFLLNLASRKAVRLPPWALFALIVVVACVLVPIQGIVPPRRVWLFLLPLWLSSAGAGGMILIRASKHEDRATAILALIVSFWMGANVLNAKSLRHSGIESVGGRSSEAIVLAVKDRLAHGAQFICSDFFDSPLDFEMTLHHIPYAPSPLGDLLIVTPKGKSPARTLELASIPENEVIGIHQIGSYEDEDVYAAKRGPGLPFVPRGTTEMGAFTHQ